MLSGLPRKTLMATAVAVLCTVPTMYAQWPEFKEKKLPRLANNLELARTALAADLPMRFPGESDEAYAARLNDAGVVASAAGQAKRAEAAFSQALEVRSRWDARAADNLAELSPAK